MSAFIVDVDHIDALITAGLAFGRDLDPVTWYHPAITDDLTDLADRTHRLTPETAGRVGAMLLAENARSVNHRYDTDEWEEPYVYHAVPGEPDPVVVLKAIRCLEYQSCEHPEWPESEAFAFCDALRHKAIAHLPGWHSLSIAWPIQDRQIFLHRTGS